MFNPLYSVCICKSTCCSHVPPSSTKISPFYVSAIPTRHGHSPTSEISRGAEGAAGRENSTLLDKLGMHNPRPMDIGCSAGFQDTFHQHAASSFPAKGKTLLTRRGGSLKRRDSDNAPQTCHRGMLLPGAGLSLVGISNTKKRRRSETSNQSEEPERIRSDGALQDGGYPPSKRPVETGRLDGQSGSKGRVLYSSDPQAGQRFPEIRLQEQDIQVQMPTFRPSVCPLGLHQDPEACSRSAETAGSEANCVYRRYTHSGRDTRPGEGPRLRPHLSPRKPGFHSQFPEMCPGTHPEDRFPGLPSRLSQSGASSICRQDQKDQSRPAEDAVRQLLLCKEASTGAGQAQCSNQGHPFGSTVLQEPSESTSKRSGEVRSRLFVIAEILRRRKGGASVVDRPPVVLERKDNVVQETNSDYRVGCLAHRLGCNVRGSEDRRTLVRGGTEVAHKLPGDPGSFLGSKMLCQGQKQYLHPTQAGQYNSSGVYKQPGGDSISPADRVGQTTLALVLPERYYPGSRTPPGGSQHNSRRGVPSDKGSLRLEAEPESVQDNPGDVGAPISGPVCLETHSSIEQVLQLETGSGGRGTECLLPGLGKNSGPAICQPPLEPGQQGTDPSASTGSIHGSGCSNMEDATLVPVSSEHANGLPNTPAEQEGPHTTDTPLQQTRGGTSTSRMAYLRDRFKGQQISQEGTKLLLASWRQKSSKSYDSLGSGYAGVTRGTPIPFRDL